jgi:hypothetical protein
MGIKKTGIDVMKCGTVYHDMKNKNWRVKMPGKVDLGYTTYQLARTASNLLGFVIA